MLLMTSLWVCLFLASLMSALSACNIASSWWQQHRNNQMFLWSRHGKSCSSDICVIFDILSLWICDMPSKLFAQAGVVVREACSFLLFLHTILPKKILPWVDIIFCIHLCCIWTMCFTFIKFQLVQILQC